jgi:hypothetical protein
LKAI